MSAIDSQTNQELFEVLRAALNPTEFECPNISDWGSIRDELKQQTVLSLVSDVVMKSSISADEKSLMFKMTASNIRHFYQMLDAEAELVKLFDANGIPVAILKGVAAAQYYPRPEHRLMGDIDVLVLPEDFERAYEMLREAGYRTEQDSQHSELRHVIFYDKQGVDIELHRYFSLGFDEEQNALLDNWLYAGIKCIDRVEVCNHQVPALPALENGLVILSHINEHLSCGLGLRQVIDWYYFVKAKCDDAFWSDSFGAKAESIGMKKLAIVITKMCQKYLGLTDSITWCSDAEDDLVDELMAYIIKKGNFGHKVEHGKNATIYFMHKLKSPGQFLVYLEKDGLLHMAQAGLKPRKSIGWLYQIWYLLRKGLKRKGDIDLIEEMRCSKAETELLKRLEVTRL